MIKEQLIQALTTLDGAAALAPLNRQQQILVVQSAELLKKFIEEQFSEKPQNARDIHEQ